MPSGPPSNASRGSCDEIWPGMFVTLPELMYGGLQVSTSTWPRKSARSERLQQVPRAKLHAPSSFS